MHWAVPRQTIPPNTPPAVTGPSVATVTLSSVTGSILTISTMTVARRSGVGSLAGEPTTLSPSGVSAKPGKNPTSAPERSRRTYGGGVTADAVATAVAVGAGSGWEGMGGLPVRRHGDRRRGHRDQRGLGRGRRRWRSGRSPAARRHAGQQPQCEDERGQAAREQERQQDYEVPETEAATVHVGRPLRRRCHGDGTPPA